MSYFDPNRDLQGRSPVSSSVPVALPSACPVCRSVSISTTAKTPDANSYWRCGKCGEVWNAARHGVRRGAGAWR
jgi:transposase-like protein